MAKLRPLTVFALISFILLELYTILRLISCPCFSPITRCVTIIDKNVENIYGTAIQAYFDEHSIELIKLVTSAEEIDKDITNLQDVLVQLKTLGVRRNEPLLVVGNGVLHDVIACAASLYHRNTPYVMLSTSVVAAIDAGLSPRTGCDGFGFKNLFGSYHPPVLALTDRSFFRTLKLGCMRHGIAEIVKMAVVKDEELFCLLEQNAAVILSTKLGTVMEDFEGDHAAFQDICDLIVGKALEELVWLHLFLFVCVYDRHESSLRSKRRKFTAVSYMIHLFF